MAKIQYLKDSSGNKVYPVTHERAVKDSAGVSLETKLGAIEAKTYIVAWDGGSTPVPANIPAGVVVTYDETDYTGTLAASASTIGKVYLVADGNDEYDRYVTSKSGATYSWVQIGNTAMTLEVVNDLTTGGTTKALSAEMGKSLDGKVTQLSNSLCYPGTQVTVEKGYYRTNINSLPTTRLSSDSVYSAIIQVIEGDKITIYGTAANSDYYRLYALYDANKNYSERATFSGDYTVTPYVLTVPSGIAYVVVNLSSYDSSTDSVSVGGRLINPGDISTDITELQTGLANEVERSNDMLIHLSKWGSSFSLSVGQYGYKTDTKKIRYNAGDGQGGNNVVDVPFLDGAIYRYNDAIYYWDSANEEMVELYNSLDTQLSNISTIIDDVGKDFLIPIIGSLLTGDANMGLPPSSVYTNRARADEFLIPPFEVNAKNGYRIHTAFKYVMSAELDSTKSVAVFGPFTGYLRKQFGVYKADGYKYRVVFAKEDSTQDISSSELANIAEYKSGLFLSSGEGDGPGKYYIDKDESELYSSYSDLLSAYDAVASGFTEQVTKSALGTTSQDVTVYEYVISTGNYNKAGRRGTRDTELSKPIIGIVSGIHGGETASINGLYYIFRDLLYGNSALTPLYENAELHIIPCANPWGFDNSSRDNANGVNINRNFDAGWYEHGQGTSDYSGSSAASEMETQIVQSWIEGLHDDGAVLVIDWHNSGYGDEISCFASCTNLIDRTLDVKKSYLFSVSSLAALLTKTNNVRKDAIWAYSATMDGSGYSNKYMEKVGQRGAILETSYNVDEQSNYSINTASVSASVMGNALLGWLELFKIS